MKFQVSYWIILQIPMSDLEEIWLFSVYILVIKLFFHFHVQRLHEKFSEINNLNPLSSFII